VATPIASDIRVFSIDFFDGPQSLVILFWVDQARWTNIVVPRSAQDTPETPRYVDQCSAIGTGFSVYRENLSMLVVIEIFANIDFSA
jgi:hypothetical protein